jgi:hypothetical protein
MNSKTMCARGANHGPGEAGTPAFANHAPDAQTHMAGYYKAVLRALLQQQEIADGGATTKQHCLQL